ncbi:MAG: glycosyltransferase family 4 protein [Anaerovoracaceae bacterium]
MNIWIFNHYATNMFYDGAGRHHSIAKYLIKNGHDVSIFCANTIHGSNRSIQIESDGFLGKTGVDGVRYIFIKTIPYKDNGFDRVKNMYSFYKNLFKVSKACLNLYNKPDVILASSVHPLTLVAGIKIAKKVNVPCICEIRDLWPETLIDLNILKAESFVSKILYRGEKWIYKKANQIIFTMPGGADYIKDKNWDNDISLDKIHYINNGVDLEKYNEDLKYNKIDDDDLNDSEKYKLIYTGSVRTVNKVDEFVKLAEVLKEKARNVSILIYGDGDQKTFLENKCKELHLDNIFFKGKVEKKYIPYVLSKGNLNIASDKAKTVGKYGISWNKIFEYMASGKPIIVNYDMGKYNMVEDYNLGIAKEYDNFNSFCDDVIKMINLPSEEYMRYSKNAKIAADKFDYKFLAKDLEKIIIETINCE